MEAVKPLLFEHGAYLNVSDTIELIGDRYYVKATATVHSSAGDISATAYAREPLTKKGMDEAQITGATSSYARKYALNGLFAIDDTKDADSQDNRGHEEPAAPKRMNKKFTDELVSQIVSCLDNADEHGLREVLGELDSDEKSYLWRNFNSAQRGTIKEMLKGE